MNLYEDIYHLNALITFIIKVVVTGLYLLMYVLWVFVASP